MVEQTPHQLKASDPKTSVWVGASAGTGKTFVLSNRVLRLMLAGSRPDKILCLTYTNNAAAEMAIRVNERLSNWISMSDETLFSELESILGEPPNNDQMFLARKLFAGVLDVPGGLKIQTIHSFCQSLLGRFPIEADISPNFDLLDDITINEQLRQSQDDLLQEIDSGSNDDLKVALNYLSGMLAEETFAKLMKNLAGERGELEELFIRQSKSFSVVISSLKQLLGIESDESRESILKLACTDNNFNLEGLINAYKTLLGGTKTDVKKGEIISGWLNNPQTRNVNFDAYKRAFLTGKDEFYASFMTKKLGEKNPHDLDVLIKEAERVKYINDRLKNYTLFENSSAILRMGFELIKTYNRRKQSRNVVDYDDLIDMVKKLLHDVSASWILFKLDGGIDHILIDEAQDTNPIQWDIIRKISEEFFSGIGTHDEDEFLENPRTIFAVGDIKQSIYSFQKAEPIKFDDNKEYFIKQARDAELDFSVVPMNLSFRSTTSVLEVVDEVFKPDDHRRAISFSADEINHDTHRANDPGLIEIWQPILPEVHEDEPGWSPPVIQQEAHDPKNKLAEKIADQIKGWIDQGEILASKGRRVTAGDILILVQKRKEFVHYMIRALKNRGVNVAGLDQMVLTDQLAVMDLMAMANFTLLPSDDLTLAVVLKSPFINMSEDDLFDLANSRDERQSLWSALLERRKDYSEVVDYLTKIMSYADFHPPYEFYSYLLGPLGGRQKLIGRLGEQINDPVDEFLNQAMKYEQNNVSSMQGFLCWIEKGDIKIKRDMEQGGDMVRIMTVHGAKGLQAPIVFLPDTCQTVRMQDNLFWYEDKNDRNLLWVRNEDTRVGAGKTAYENRKSDIEDENKRLLYVAMTRAEDRLYVTGFEDKNGRKEDCWYDMIKNAVAEMDGIEEIEIGDEKILRREHKQTSPLKKAKEEKAVTYVSPDIPKWLHELPPAEPVPGKPLSPSRAGDGDDEISRSPLNAFEQMKRDKQKYHRGRLIHKLLELLPGQQVEDRKEAAIRYLSQSALDLPPVDIEQISEEVMAIFENDDFAELFGPNSRAEVPIVGQIGNFSLSGQVDRLAISDSEILIIDYKTNRPPPKSAAAIPKIYQRQMAVYRAVLSDIYPDHKVRSFLLWTDIGALMEIPDDNLNKIRF